MLCLQADRAVESELLISVHILSRRHALKLQDAEKDGMQLDMTKGHVKPIALMIVKRENCRAKDLGFCVPPLSDACQEDWCDIGTKAVDLLL